MEFFHQLSSSDFMPHGFCYLWDSRIVWLNVIADGLIALSYYCIPVILVYFVRKNRDLPFNRIFWMFGTFILACGTTHLMEIWNIWHGSYLLAGVVKAITAAVSVVTAAMLIPLVPKVISLPGRMHSQRQEITERKLAEKEIQRLNDELEQRVAERTVQLETAIKELESFSYSISHDLRAPLRHIIGFSKLLVEEFGPTLDPGAQHYLDRIHAGTQKMGLLVDELLNLAKVGRHAIAWQATRLNPIVEEVVKTLEPDVQGREVQWVIADLPRVECDAALVKQIFQHLLANALKFTRTRTTAVIQISHRQISHQQIGHRQIGHQENTEDGQPVFMVRDNGVGFSMKYVDKLFGVFQRLHRPEDFEGTGIGLATVQRIVQKHGGRIWAEGEVDKGATFYFTLGAGKQAQSKANGAMAGGQS